MTYKDANGNNVNTTIANVLSDLTLTTKFQRVLGVFTHDGTNYVRATAISENSTLQSLLPVGTATPVVYYLGVAAQNYVAPTTGTVAYYQITVNRYSQTNIVLVDEPVVIDNATVVSQIDVLRQSSLGVNTTIQAIFADIDTKEFAQTLRAVMYDTTTSAYVPFVAQAINATTNPIGLLGLYIEVTPQNNGTKAYIPVNVLAASTDVAIHPVTGQEVITASTATTVNVANGTTIANLLAAIEPAKFFQTAQVLNNAGMAKSSQTVFANDILRITSQSGAVQDYIIAVDATPVVGSTTLVESSDKVSVTGNVITLTVKDMTVVDFLKLFSVTGDTSTAKATLTVFASNGDAKWNCTKSIWWRFTTCSSS